MAENKNALVNETAIENGNAALTERLDNVAERMAEAEKATAAVAAEHSLRRAEQEQNSEQLQKAEEERRAQAQEAAKSVADRRAAVLDYTENYRQNQKIEKAARATVSKAKLERLAAEAEAKARAEREAEENLRREREELMARRQRSSALLKKVENESEAEAPVKEETVAAPAEKAMPKEAPAAQMPEVPEAPVQEAAQAPAEAEAEAPAVQDEAPNILNIGVADLAFADDAASAVENGAEEQNADAAEAAGEDEVATNNIEALDLEEDNGEEDPESAKAEELAKLQRMAVASLAVNEDLTKARIAQMMPAHLIPESLRLHNSKGTTGDARMDEMVRRIEDAVLAAASQRTDNSAAALYAQRARNAKSNEELAGIAVAAGVVSANALPAIYGAGRFNSQELREYMRVTKQEIAEKKKDLKRIKPEKHETEEEFERRHIEAQGAVLGTELAAIALLSHKGHREEAASFKKQTEADIRICNKSIAKYNQTADQPLTPLSEALVRKTAQEGKLPQNLPFGSAATGHDAALMGGENKDSSNTAEQVEQDALQKELQKQMLLHAMVWNPAAASAIREMLEAYAAENKDEALAAAIAPFAERSEQDDLWNADVQHLLEEYEDSIDEDIKAERALADANALVARESILNRAKPDASFEKNEIQRLVYYENRIAMIEAKREDLEELSRNMTHFSAGMRREIAAERRLDLIKDEIALLCLLNRYPNERIGKRYREICTRDIEEYNLLVSGISGKYKNTKPLSKILPSQALAEGAGMPDVAFAELYFALRRWDEKTILSRPEEEEKFAPMPMKDSAEPMDLSSQLAVDRLAREYERMIRAFAAEEAYLSKKDRKNARLPGKKADQAEDAHRSKKDKKNARLLGKAADQAEENMELVQLAKDATDKSTMLSKEKKSQILSMAIGVAANAQSAKEAKKLQQMARAAGKKEARAAEKDKKALLRADKEMERRLGSSYDEVGLDAAKKQRNTAKLRYEQKQAAAEALQAVSATVGAQEALRSKPLVSKRMSREMNVAIENAERRCERATFVSAQADEKALRMLKKRSGGDDLSAARRRSASFKSDVAYAEDQLNTLLAARDAASCSTAMSKNERAELLSLAIQFSEQGDIQSVERLKNHVAAALKKEERAEHQDNRMLVRKLGRLDKKVAEAEAQARVYEQAAYGERSKANSLAEKTAANDILYQAYEKAQYRESRAEEARRTAEAAKRERKDVRNRATSHESAKAALLVLAATVAVAERKLSKQTKPPVSPEMQRLNTAIADAENRYENAVVRESAFKASAAYEKNAANKEELQRLRTETVRAEDRLDTLRAAKRALEDSHALSRGERAEIINLVLATEADTKNKKTSQKLKKKIAVAAKKEARAAKKAVRSMGRGTSEWEKTVVEAEAAALMLEGSAKDAKRRADRLAANRKTDKKLVQRAYDAALAEEKGAERARKAADAVRSMRSLDQECADEHKNAHTAMLAFATAFTIEGKNKTAKKAKVYSSGTRQERNLEFAIMEARADYERVSAERDAALENVSGLGGRRTSRSDSKVATAALTEAGLDVERARNRLQMLECAKTALEKSTVLSRKEKDGMLALVLDVNRGGKNKKSATRLQKKIAIAAVKEAKAEEKLAKKVSSTEAALDHWYLDQMASALAAEQMAAAAGYRSDRLKKHGANKKELSKVYEQQILESSQATNARNAAKKSRAMRHAKAERSQAHKEANLAMLAFADAVAYSCGLKGRANKKKDLNGAHGSMTLSVEAAILDAEKRCERATVAHAELKEKAAALSGSKLSRKERKTLAAELDCAESELLIADSRLQALQAAKRVNDSNGFTAEEKAELLNSVMAESADRKTAKHLKSKKKAALAAKRRAKAERAFAKKSRMDAKRKEKLYASSEAQILVSEEAALLAQTTVDLSKNKKLSKKELYKLYKKALSEKANATKAHQNASVARASYAPGDSLQAERKESEIAMLALAAAMVAESKGKNAKRYYKKNGPALVSGQMLGAMSALEAQAYASACEEKALNAEKKAFLLAATRGKKRTKLKTYEEALLARAEATQAKTTALALQYERELDGNVPLTRKAKKLMSYADKAVLAREKATMKLAEKMASRSGKKQSKSMGAYAMPSDLHLHGMHMEKGVAVRTVSRSSAFAVSYALFNPKIMKKRLRAFRKQDMKTLMARYDSEIAETKRALELSLCDLSCTAPMRRRLKYETAKRLQELKRKRRKAIRMEKADNRRYFACLRKNAIKPKNRLVNRAALMAMREQLFRLLEQRDEENAKLYSFYLAESYRKASKVHTPWHNAFLREKKHWHRKSRRDLRRVDEMNLSRRDKQKLRADLDRVATAHADIAEAKTRARKIKLSGSAVKRQYRQELDDMRREVVRAHKNMKRKMKYARIKEDRREFWRVSLLSLATTAVLVGGCVILWRMFGDPIVSFLDTHFPNIMSQLK